MCGISGSLNWQGTDALRIVQRMTRALAHRGPDAENVVALGPMILGHRRLSIIDTASHSNQPMHDHTKRYWIVYNGELYNFKKLRADLKARGHHFLTESDTEVILEAWKQWGVDCLLHFTGMFAFALWDTVTENLFLARDRLGEKPLYYTIQQQGSHYQLVFASELTALRLHPAVSNRINPKAVSQFLSLNYVLTDACILEGVEKLPPAHFLLLKKHHSPQIKCYWDLKSYFQRKKTWGSKQEASQYLKHLLQDSVKQQTISDVPLGAFLSGGIDSSSIVAAIRKTIPSKLIQTFSIGFQEKSYSELAESQSVAHFLGVNHHTQTVNANMATLLPRIIQATDEPFADSSIIPTYFLAQFSRKNVTVCLSGDGGDELFAGYETYLADKLHHWVSKLPKRALAALTTFIEKTVPVSHKKVSFDYKLKQFLKGCALDYQQAHYFWRVIFETQDKAAILHPDRRSSVLAFNPFDSFHRFYQAAKGLHPLDQAAFVDIKTWLVDDILVKVDRMTMAHSLEARAPFLNHHLVEFAASLPIEWKLKGFEKKHILKTSQQHLLPHNILHRAKKGFNAPIGSWFSGELQTLGREVTTDSSLGNWFYTPNIEVLWHEHLTHQKDHSLKLFGLTCFGLWLSNLHTTQEEKYDLRNYSSVQ